MTLDEFATLLSSMEGVRRTIRSDRSEWRYRGRLVARELDDDAVVIRAEFSVRRTLVELHPGTFRVPSRFERHMMVVADLATADGGAIEDAVRAAWDLQRRGQ